MILKNHFETAPFFWRFSIIFRIDGCKQKQTLPSCGDLLDVSVFRDNKTKRMRTMKNMKNLVIEEPPNSLIVTANKKIYVPEKKIILMDQVTEMVPLHKGSLSLTPDPPFHGQILNMLEENFTFNPGYHSFYCTSLKHNFSATS